MTGEWEPEKYEDRYQVAVQDMIERKVQKLPPAKLATARTTGPAVNLLAVLQQSLKENADARKTGGGTRGTRPRLTASLVKQKRRVAA
jgi:non-homologous end joining protein Ku